MNFDIVAASDRWMSAAANGLAQGVGLALLVVLALRLLPRVNATTRHAALFMTLLAVAGLPVAHGLRDGWLAERARSAELPPPSSEPEPMIAATGESVPDLAAEPPSWSAGAREEATTPLPSQVWSWRADLSRMRARIAHLAIQESLPLASAPSETAALEIPSDQAGAWAMAADLLPSPAVPESTESEPAAAGAISRWALDAPKVWEIGVPSWLSLSLWAAWGGVAFFRLGRLGMECLALRRLKARAEAPDPAALAVFERVVAELKPERSVRLGVSPEIEIPMLVGYRHPMVMLPAAMESRDASLGSILRHELAHLARRDDGSNLIQQGLRAVFFFHPLVAWLSHRLTLEREIACDDHVLAALGNPRQYALLLTEFAAGTAGRDYAAAPAAWSQKSQLKERIHMILDPQRNASPRLARAKTGTLAAAALLAALLGVAAGPRLLLAQNPPAAPQPPAPPSADGVAVATTASVSATASVEPVVSVSITTDETGPRKKSVASAASAPAAAPAPAPAAAALPAPPALPAPAKIALTAPALTLSAPVVAVVPPAAVSIAGPVVAVADVEKPGRRAPLEDRLDRLERMVESLLEHQGGKEKNRGDARPNPKPHPMPHPAPHPDARPGPSEKQLREIHEQAERAAQEGIRQAERAAQEAVRAAERAARDIEKRTAEQSRRQEQELQRHIREITQQAERAAQHQAREAERMAQEHARLAERAARDKVNDKGRKQEEKARRQQAEDGRRDLENQKRSFEARRRALEQQMENLERQIEELEEQEERIEEQQEEIEERLEEQEEHNEAKDHGDAEHHHEHHEHHEAKAAANAKNSGEASAKNASNGNDNEDSSPAKKKAVKN